MDVKPTLAAHGPNVLTRSGLAQSNAASTKREPNRDHGESLVLREGLSRTSLKRENSNEQTPYTKRIQKTEHESLVESETTPFAASLGHADSDESDF